MKKSKILVPAVALLALSTAAATTGTVAWFTTNTAVSAKQLTMSVVTAKDLRIAEGHGDTYSWETALTWNDASDSIGAANPVAAIDGAADNVKAVLGQQITEKEVTNVGFVKPTKGNTIQANGQATTALSTGDMSASYEDVTASGNYILHNYSLRYAGTEGTTEVTFKITVTSADTPEINNAFRVGILDSSKTAGKKLFTAHKLSGFTSDKYVMDLGNLTLKNNIPYHLSIYTWYEGTDAACINANAVTRQLGVSIDHTIYTPGV